MSALLHHRVAPTVLLVVTLGLIEHVALGSEPEDPLVGVIVKLEDDSLAAYRGGVAGLAATSPTVTGAKRLNPQSVSSRAYLARLSQRQDVFESDARRALSTSRVIYRYQAALSGVAMVVRQSEVARLKDLPGVKAVYPDELLHLDTSRTPKFIGANKLWNSLGGKENAGEGMIVGILDTGIWPEHPSFSNPDPSGKPYPPLPAKWHGSTCQFTGGANPGPAFTCNNKLIGAYRFLASYEALAPLGPGELTTARDDDGHGTHVASTAAGNPGVAATILGSPKGTISGIAPRAHVVAYKVCGAKESPACPSSDSVAAIEQAIMDGVDVINFSISGGTNPYQSAVELAFLDAYAAGIFVATSGGNDGPTAESVAHRGPWVTTVAASTKDRTFESTLNLSATGGDMLVLSGVSSGLGLSPAMEVVNAADFGDERCQASTPAGTFSGKIVVCRRGTNDRVAKSANVAQRGALGMILYNPTINTLEADGHIIPTVHIDHVAGASLLAFLGNHTGEMASFTAGVSTSAPGDLLAVFSSRGGAKQELGVSKPDLTAPGVQILAGQTPQPASVTGVPPGSLFQIISGTSMSSPHVAGAAALLKDLHPGWTPGQIKSALMTTATPLVLKEDGITPAGPFDDGSGRIDLKRARKPRLTFDVPASDYTGHEDDLWNVNYPSLYLPVMPGQITVHRTAHDVSGSASQWQLMVSAPPDVFVTVPAMLDVPAGGDAPFDITVDGKTVPLGEVRHATLSLIPTTGTGTLIFPITFVRRQAGIELTTSCSPATISLGGATSCTITVQNKTFAPVNVKVKDKAPKKLTVQAGSVSGGSVNGNTVTYSGTLAAGTPPQVMAGSLIPGLTFFSLANFAVARDTRFTGPNLIFNFDVLNFTGQPRQFRYGGELHRYVGMASNGHLIIDGAFLEDYAESNQVLPDPARPNNVLAPFWTDLDPSKAPTSGGPGNAPGGIRVGYRSPTDQSGTRYFATFEWDRVPNKVGGELNSLQVLIGLSGDADGDVEDIRFLYGPQLSSGSEGKLTVGAENKHGNSGFNLYVNGTGSLPAPNGVFSVASTAEAPGEAHSITFTAQGAKLGSWNNCPKLTSAALFGTSLACFPGAVQ